MNSVTESIGAKQLFFAFLAVGGANEKVSQVFGATFLAVWDAHSDRRRACVTFTRPGGPQRHRAGA